MLSTTACDHTTAYFYDCILVGKSALIPHRISRLIWAYLSNSSTKTGDSSLIKYFYSVWFDVSSDGGYISMRNAFELSLMISCFRRYPAISSPIENLIRDPDVAYSYIPDTFHLCEDYYCCNGYMFRFLFDEINIRKKRLVFAVKDASHAFLLKSL